VAFLRVLFVGYVFVLLFGILFGVVPSVINDIMLYGVLWFGCFVMSIHACSFGFCCSYLFVWCTFLVDGRLYVAAMWYQCLVLFRFLLKGGGGVWAGHL
jgi:hypothetical protein